MTTETRESFYRSNPVYRSWWEKYEKPKGLSFDDYVAALLKRDELQQSREASLGTRAASQSNPASQSTAERQMAQPQLASSDKRRAELAGRLMYEARKWGSPIDVTEALAIASFQGRDFVKEAQAKAEEDNVSLSEAMRQLEILEPGFNQAWLVLRAREENGQSR